jgi:sterol desaturase/sphingolipid hydroxylase (fatty acid hydroxylase superfamily)
LIVTIVWSVVALIGVALQALLIRETNRDLKAADKTGDKAMKLIARNNLYQEQARFLMQCLNLVLGVFSLVVLLSATVLLPHILFVVRNLAVIAVLLGVEFILLLTGFLDFLIRRKLKESK